MLLGLRLRVARQERERFPADEAPAAGVKGETMNMNRGVNIRAGILVVLIAGLVFGIVLLAHAA
jgi:hypothetical protein